MEFAKFNEKLQAHVREITKNASHLFEVSVDKDVLWNMYLDSFPAGTNEIFRVRREYDCSCCRHFVKHFGNVVTIKDGKVSTIWGFQVGDPTFQTVVDALDAFVKQQVIMDVFVSREHVFGVKTTHEEDKETGKLRSWNHFHVELPNSFALPRHELVGQALNVHRGIQQVFGRSLAEITPDAAEAVRDMAQQGSLYAANAGTVALLNQFLDLQKKFKALTGERERSIFVWEHTVKVGGALGNLRNSNLGTLLVALSEGEDLEAAVRQYEKQAAPENYKRPKAIFTAKMLEEAKATVEKMGLMESLPRRMANLNDISVNNILFANRDAKKSMSDASDVFADMAKAAAVPNSKAISKMEEIPIEKFLSDVLPTATTLEVLLENRHANSMVTLVAPQNKGCPAITKWDNGFTWAYTGNVTDSSMRDRVKAAGGCVEGVLRFSIQWNDDNHKGVSDLDAHAHQPDGSVIMYSTYRGIRNKNTGMLDVDERYPSGKVGVENINWLDKSKMQEGEYIFNVHNFSDQGGNHGFSAEVEFDGQIFPFSVDRPLRSDETVEVARVVFSKKDGFTFKSSLSSAQSSRTHWGLQVGVYHPVSVCMLSPNYWDENKGMGHKHYFFMLQGCITEETPNGFFNEFLPEAFTPHRRVLEALGSKMRVQAVEDQLSGVGFSSTKRNDVVVRVGGSYTRTLKVMF